VRGNDHVAPAHGEYAPWPVVLLFNVVAIAVLAAVIRTAEDRPLGIIAPCVTPNWRAFFGAVVLMSFGHGIVRVVGKSAPPPNNLLLQMIRSLHPWRLCPRSLYVLSAVGIVMGFAGLTPWSPCNLVATTPAVQEFKVRQIGGPVSAVTPGGEYIASNVHQYVVEPLCLVGAIDIVKCGATVPDDDPNHATCDWSTNQGRLLPDRGCAIRYLPGAVGPDTLAVAVHSPCGRRGYTEYASIHIRVE
jgi:hypothetical protein